jgi:hypothetical protein
MIELDPELEFFNSAREDISTDSGGEKCGKNGPTELNMGKATGFRAIAHSN